MDNEKFIRQKSPWERFTLTDRLEPKFQLKALVWIYFLLLVFEGALRKWFLPFLSTPLLLVRDPIIVWLLYEMSRRGLFKLNGYLAGILILGIATYLTAAFFGHGNTLVALYGLRTLLLYFPMIFMIGTIFNQDDVLRMGKIMLYIAIPMTLLIGMQFYSPQSALVNRGIGGDESGAGFGGALGYFRPSGTFSFTNGITLFYSAVTPFLIYFWLNSSKINKKILIAATAAVLIAIPLSISRGLFLQICVSVFFLVISVSRNPKYFGKIVTGVFLVFIALIILSNLTFFQTATAAFTDRFEGANEIEGGLVEGVVGDRFLGQLVRAVMGAGDRSVFGLGIGSGTPLGEKLLNDNSVSMMADFEWMRLIGEIGLLGLLVIFIRVGLTVKLSVESYRKMINKSTLLPWLIMSDGVLIVSQGSWHQPTALGFFTFIGGLWIASMKVVRKTNIQYS